MTAEERINRLRERLRAPVARQNLGRASLVLMLYELLKSDIIDGVKRFFVWPVGCPPFGRERYEKYVLSLVPGKVFDSSCAWLLDMKAINREDIEFLREFREYRNAVAHELIWYVIDADRELNCPMLLKANELLRRVGTFWARIEIDSDEQYDGKVILDEDIQSMSSIIAEFAISVVENEE